MKKISKLAIFTVATALSTSMALADGMVFEPIDMPTINNTQQTQTPIQPKTISQPPQEAPKTTNNTEESKFSNLVDKIKSNDEPKVADMNLKENQKMQNALADLDCSQVELRQNLQTLQQKYNSVDANYQKYKEERKILNKEIRSVNKKLNNLDKVKEAIRKNML